MTLFVVHLGQARRSFTHTGILAAGLLLSFAVVPTAVLAQSYNVTGKWEDAITEPHLSAWDKMSGLTLISGGGTHMALLRGNADSTWILHWHASKHARLWLVEPANEAVAVAVPVPTVGVPPTSISEIFCSGHSTLADGKLLVVGGTVPSEIGTNGLTGETKCLTFDATRYFEPSGGWRLVDTTAQGHWYPTATTLNDGRVLATAGSQWYNMVMVGGQTGPTTAVKDMRLLNLRKHARWDPDPTDAMATKPTERQGHSAVLYNGVTVIFGGDVATGAAPNPTRDVWDCYGEDLDTGRSWQWNPRPTDPDPSAGYPLARSRHTAVVRNGKMIVFGGFDGAGAVLPDVWELDLTTGTNPYKWKKLTTTGSSTPGARYGHVAMYRPTPSPVMLIYGGLGAPGFYADADVYQLDLTSETSKPWTKLIPTGTNPGKREGHSVAAYPVQVHTSPPYKSHRFFIHGGTKFGAGRVNDTKELKFDEGGGTNGWAWSTEVATPGYALPPGRTRHAAAFDADLYRMVVFGGEVSAGLSQSLWVLPLLKPGAQIWKQIAADGMPSARMGHSLTYDDRSINAHIPEVYAPGEGAIGKWTAQDQPVNGAGRRLLPYYPHMFQLSNPAGDVFFSGNGPGETSYNSLRYSVGAQSWTNSQPSNFLGGSAVMHANPDIVLKFGGDDDYTDGDSEDPVENRTDVWTPAGGWDDQTPIEGEPRTYHNLTVLPTGEIVMTGGKSHNKLGGDFIETVRIKTPTQPEWSDPLAPDPVGRGYHSSALLLPDARVLCASGLSPNEIESTSLAATIYAPRNLYSGATSEATRPVITNRPATMQHGSQYYVYVNVDVLDIASVCLIRPGAPTHGFDQNQRYVKLSFVPEESNGRLRVTAPPDGNAAPPGDYMLFVLEGNVPSLAKWVRVGTDAIPPAAVNDLEGTMLPSSVILTWTASGDDGSGPGRAHLYDLRYSMTPINEANFAYATHLQLDTPAAAGNGQVVVVQGLGICTEYYFAVKTVDEMGNWSALSNVPYAQTQCGCCGYSASEAMTEEALGAQPVGSSAKAGTADIEIAWLGGAAKFDARHGIRVVNVGPTPIELDSVALVSATAQADRLPLASGSELRWAAKEPITAVRSLKGDDVAVGLASSQGHEVSAGDVWIVSLGAAAGGPRHLMLGTVEAKSSNTASASGIELQQLGRAGNWVTRERCAPAADADIALWRDIVPDSVRLVFHGGYRVKSLNRLVTVSGAPSSEPLRLESIYHSRLGGLTSDTGALGEEAAVLLEGDEVRLEFAGADSQAEPGELFLVLASSATSTAMARSTSSIGPLAPRSFALGPSAPNPVSEVASFRYDLPVATTLNLTIYDMQGRRVASLVDGHQSAGAYTEAWSLRGRDGKRVAPGIYMCQLRAGAFRAERKVVVLP